MHMAGEVHRPRIGMVGERRPASYGTWTEVELCFVWATYADAIARAGGAPVAFPPVEAYADDPALALDAVDGLLLTGGRDIDARSYGAERHPANDEGDPIRDRIELALGRAALERGLAILGVCRGMQMLNLLAGGGIDQHLDDPSRIHRGDSGTFVGHRVAAVDGTRLASIIGTDSIEVRSHHHQGVEPLAEGFVVAARSEDGLTEGAEAPDRGFCVSVLWHPEEDLAGGGLKLYEALVDAARETRAAAAAA
jgi:putative glutamine amidotransferase